jgi:hypothetical protein
MSTVPRLVGGMSVLQDENFLRQTWAGFWGTTQETYKNANFQLVGTAACLQLIDREDMFAKTVSAPMPLQLRALYLVRLKPRRRKRTTNVEHYVIEHFASMLPGSDLCHHIGSQIRDIEGNSSDLFVFPLFLAWLHLKKSSVHVSEAYRHTSERFTVW